MPGLDTRSSVNWRSIRRPGSRDEKNEELDEDDEGVTVVEVPSDVVELGTKISVAPKVVFSVSTRHERAQRRMSTRANDIVAQNSPFCACMSFGLQQHF